VAGVSSPVDGRIHSPLLVVLADDGRARPAVGRPVVEVLLHLPLDEGALLLDHDDVFQAAAKRRMPTGSSGQVMPTL
jgi:hypothetical protein